MTYSATCPTRYCFPRRKFCRAFSYVTIALTSCMQSSLGIVVTRDDNFAIECIEVPKGVYATIQRDPFSFVAAETLSTLDVFSNWHLTIVAFATMTLIFIGQFLSDLFRSYVLPGSSTWWGLR